MATVCYCLALRRPRHDYIFPDFYVGSNETSADLLASCSCFFVRETGRDVLGEVRKEVCRNGRCVGRREV